MNSGSRTGERRYAQKVEKPSKVLLVCIYDTVVIDITNEIIRSRFDQFGKIIKMLIFEKGEVTKLFLEYEQVDQAVKAKNKLDGTKLYEAICKMTIYYSNFSNVEIASEPLDDPYQEQGCFLVPTQNSQMDGAGQQRGWVQEVSGNQAYNVDIDDDQIMESFNSFTKAKRSKTQNPTNLAWELQKMNNPVPIHYHQQKSIQIKYQKKQNSWALKKQEQKVIKMKEDTDIRSSVLWFAYRYPIKPKHIYNLFSNFGNISSVIVKKQNAYIKFRSKQFAAMASTYLNNTVLLGNIMDLRQCPQDSNSWRLQQGEYSQSVYYDLNYDRFTPQRSITINPPANTIHISSIKREICKEKNLGDIFSKHGQIQKIQILQNSVDKNMALVKFRTLEDSFNAIAELHNQIFLGRKMQISFTKSKL